MIQIKDLLQNPEIYKQTLKARGLNPAKIDELIEAYQLWKENLQVLDKLRQEKNEFNKKIVKLTTPAEKQTAIQEMKETSTKISELESKDRELYKAYQQNLKAVPSLISEQTPIGKDDNENPVIETFGEKPEYDFTVKPYWELGIYNKYVGQKEGVKAMGSRGYYIRGELARFQRVLFNWAEDYILSQGLESFYVPLMLNQEILTGTGHLPDFEGQQYEVNIDENKSYYLIGSSEPSIMGYFYGQNLGTLQKPELLTCWSSCFRKEAGSYGRDQQGILRVHQFEKIEMVAICRPEEAEDLFQKFGQIDEGLYSKIGLYYQKVEVCSGDLPSKHFRQQDYNAWFPATQNFREISSNGNASDYQNLGLGITYINESGEKNTPYGLNCTGITQRAMLAILEQNQTQDGRVKVPEVLVKSFGKEYIE